MFSLEEHLEEQKKRVLSIRSMELSASDWTQVADAPLTAEEKQEWATYRQQWRDITAQEGYPIDIRIPFKPQG